MLVSKQFLQVCQISKESEELRGKMAKNLLIWHGMTLMGIIQVPGDGGLKLSQYPATHTYCNATPTHHFTIIIIIPFGTEIREKKIINTKDN